MRSELWNHLQSLMRSQLWNRLRPRIRFQLRNQLRIWPYLASEITSDFASEIAGDSAAEFATEFIINNKTIFNFYINLRHNLLIFIYIKIAMYVTLLLKNIYFLAQKVYFHCFINNGRLLLNLNALKRLCYSDIDPATKIQFFKYIISF